MRRIAMAQADSIFPFPANRDCTVNAEIGVDYYIMAFGEVRETPQMITKGVFSVVRHPVYHKFLCSCLLI